MNLVHHIVAHPAEKIEHAAVSATHSTDATQVTHAHAHVTRVTHAHATHTHATHTHANIHVHVIEFVEYFAG